MQKVKPFLDHRRVQQKKRREWLAIYIPTRPIGMARSRYMKRQNEIYPQSFAEHYCTFVSWFDFVRKEENMSWIFPLHGAVEVEFIFKTPEPVRHEKKSYPKSPNLISASNHIILALVGHAWVSKSQISKMTISKSFGPTATIIKLKPLHYRT